MADAIALVKEGSRPGDHGKVFVIRQSSHNFRIVESISSHRVLTQNPQGDRAAGTPKGRNDAAIEVAVISGLHQPRQYDAYIRFGLFFFPPERETLRGNEWLQHDFSPRE